MQNLKSLLLAIVFLTIVFTLHAQNGYNFTVEKELPHTTARDQGNTGTCWSYATTSFIESELLRKGKEEVDLSELFFVNHVYRAKAHSYVMRHGTANFSQGGQAHDVMNAIRKFGIATEEAYSGKNYENKKHNHDELEALLSGMVNNLVKIREKMPLWPQAIQSVINVYLGEVPETFSWNDKTYTPKDFQKEIGINPEEYIAFTSYRYYPMYEKINLDIPDNWSFDTYYNVPIDELMLIIDNSIEQGYTVVWDGDVSEIGFNYKKMIAVVPTKESLKDDEFLNKPMPEIEITQELREKMFLSQQSTDDHLMHLIGTSKDTLENKYYIIKNSWNSNSNEFDGKLHMSKAYAKAHTVNIMVHKDVVPKSIMKKFK